MIFRMSLNDLPFQLQLKHRNGFVHSHIQLQIFHIIIIVVIDRKHTAIAVFISLHGKGHKRDQINTVAVLQYIQISIAH